MVVLTVDAFLEAHGEDEFRALTGLSTGTFRLIFNKYCGAGTPIPKPHYLFALFKFYKLYPVLRAWRTIVPGLRSRKSFFTRLRKWEVSEYSANLRCYR
jgi:hypothetical protein